MFRLSKGRPPKLMVSIKATDDRELRAAVFYHRQHDTVIGGTELAGKNQTLELALPLDTKLPDGPDLFDLLSSPESPAGQGGGRILTLLADAGGNIVTSHRRSRRGELRLACGQPSSRGLSSVRLPDDKGQDVD